MLDFLDHRRHPGAVTVGSLIGLGAGIAVGVTAHELQHAGLDRFIAALEPVGTVWTSALRMIILPLIVAHIAVSVAGGDREQKVGRMAGLSFTLFVLLLLLGGGLAVGLASPLIAQFTVDAESVASLRAGVSTVPAQALAGGTLPSLGEWIVGLIPTNVIEAAANDRILPVIVATLLFSAALRSVPYQRREILVSGLRAVGEVTLTLANWIIRVIPLAVFALTAVMSASVGLVVASSIGFFIILVSLLLLACTLMLYPIASIGGGISLRRFARGVGPSQAIAVGTRSSIATLPALLEGAKRRLAVEACTAEFVLPLAVSTFKLNRTISSPIKLLFLAHMFGVQLEPQTIFMFVLAVVILSFGSPGIPSGGSFITLPFYLAAGVPVEGVVLLKAVDAIPDIFKTLLNVTADMTVATLVARMTSTPAIGDLTTAEAVTADAAVDIDLPRAT